MSSLEEIVESLLLMHLAMFFKSLVFYQLCHLSLVIPLLSLVIPGLSLLVPSRFQDVPDSSCLTFNQQYINCYNKLNLLDIMIWHIFQKNIWCKRTSCLCVNNVRKVIYENKNKTLKWKQCMLIFRADQDSERDYGIKGYYNTEFRACTK